jgi:DNA helicase IV
VSSQDLRDEQEREQRYVAHLYGQLDIVRAAAELALDQSRRTRSEGTPAARSERDAFVALHSARVSQLRGVEDKLCFGRLDVAPDIGADADTGTGALERRYIGRIGLADEDSPTRAQLLIDWRAPAAQPFYQATAANPQGVLRRRHIATHGREVTGIEDEILDLSAFASAGEGAVAGEGALFLALNAARTGRMRDIVSTIQAEQDSVIRAPLEGVLVIQGGPGTGKTAVALHRTAYLLYTYRARIARSGVLLVGPNPVFLRYIEQVLPALGEAGAVVMATAGRLFPGVDAQGRDEDEAARIKGDLRMAEVIARAVANRERVPSRPLQLQVEQYSVTLRPRDVAGARDHARRGGKPHNEARLRFVRDILGRLARQLGDTSGVEAAGDGRGDLLATLRESRDVRREVNWAWGPITPHRLIRNLFADPAELAAAADGILTRAEQAALARERTAEWTVEDVPLLDEAAELLGDEPDPTGDAERGRSDQREQLDQARRALDTSGANGMITAAQLVERYAGDEDLDSLADRAAADRSWAFGHIVIDEAQEQSAMMWRLLMRRCPTRSMTVVGDVAQTGAAAGVSDWADALAPYVSDRWRLARLGINYRTPAQMMTLAADVLAASGSAERAPRSARDGRWAPSAERVGTAREFEEAVVQAVRADLAAVEGGRVAVICPHDAQPGLAAALDAALPGQVESGAQTLESPVTVLRVREAKGLEFDSVVLIEPAQIIAESPRGLNDLYVALTRATQRLHVVHSADLPPSLRRLAYVDA